MKYLSRITLGIVTLTYEDITFPVLSVQITDDSMVRLRDPEGLLKWETPLSHRLVQHSGTFKWEIIRWPWFIFTEVTSGFRHTITNDNTYLTAVGVKLQLVSVTPTHKRLTNLSVSVIDSRMVSRKTDKLNCVCFIFQYEKRIDLSKKYNLSMIISIFGQ